MTLIARTRNLFLAASILVMSGAWAQDPDARAKPLPSPGDVVEPGRSVAKERSRGARSSREKKFAGDLPVLPRKDLRDKPYEFLGFLSFRSGGDTFFGSGTIVRPRGVLTCAHNLWDFRGGWSTNVRFERQRFRGQKNGVFRPSNLFIQPGYIEYVERTGDSETNAAFANDIAWMAFPRNLGKGVGAPYKTRFNALTGRAYNEAIGYGEGTTPKIGIPTLAYRRVGNTPYFLNSSYDHLGGMSGGPIFARIRRQLVVVGVVVSSGGGIRALEPGVVSQLNALP